MCVHAAADGAAYDCAPRRRQQARASDAADADAFAAAAELPAGCDTASYVGTKAHYCTRAPRTRVCTRAKSCAHLQQRKK